MPATTRTPAVEPRMRWMIHRDLPDVLRIEADCFGAAAWGESELKQHLRHRSCIGMVVEDRAHSDQIAAHLMYRLRARCVELLRFAVAPEYHRCGVGLYIMAKMRMKLGPASHRRQFLRVWVSDADLGTHLFLKAAGFRAVGMECEPDGDRYLFQISHAD